MKGLGFSFLGNDLMKANSRHEGQRHLHLCAYTVLFYHSLWAGGGLDRLSILVVVAWPLS